MQKGEAVALMRVSTKEQAEDGHSLDSQAQNVYQAADVLDCTIVKDWSLSKSRRKGKEIRKKDLEEIRLYCKGNKRVKYLLIDKVNRFMREVDLFYWYVMEFRMMGVTVWFCAQEQQDLNGTDQLAQLKRFLAIYEAEADNRERAQTSKSRMVARVEAGYYPFPLKPGYIKSETPGLHAPDGRNSKLLQEAAQRIITFEQTPSEALATMNEAGFINPTGNPMRIDKFKRTLVDPFYHGRLVINDWPEADGNHQHLWTEDGGNKLRQIIEGKKRPHERKKRNPEFPLANFIGSIDCGNCGKVSGFFKVNGKNNGWKAPKYRCRPCGREYNRQDIHSALSRCLTSIDLSPGTQKDIVAALDAVWRSRQRGQAHALSQLLAHTEQLEGKKNNLVLAVADPSNASIKPELLKQVDTAKEQIAQAESKANDLRDNEGDLVAFTSFALAYLADLKEHFWELDYDQQVWCEKMLFPEGFYIKSASKIHTPKISALIALPSDYANKKEPDTASDSLMVELRGIAPRSESSQPTHLQA